MHVEERTDFVDVFPTTSLKTLLAVVKDDAKPGGKAVGLAVENIVSYGMGQFLHDDTPVMFAKAPMQAAAPCSKEECVSVLESAIAAKPDGTMKAAGKIDWKSLLTTVLPFILKLLI